MSVDVIARAEARIASLSTDAAALELGALRLAQRAADCRMGVRDLQNFITMARELAEDETEPQAAMPAQTDPVGAEGVLAGQALVESPAKNTETSAAMPGSGDGDADASSASAGEESAASPATLSAATPMDEVGIASSSEELPERAVLHPADPPRSGAAEGNEADPSAPEDQSLAKASEAEPVATQSVQPEGDASRPSIGGGTDAPIGPEPVTENADATPQAGGETQAPPAPSKRELVRETHEAHPDWTAKQIGEHLGLTIGSVSGHLSNMKIRLSGPAQDGAPTKLDKVRIMHHAHPTWTARMIAEELGEKETSVSTMLAVVRKASGSPTPPQPINPEFSSRREMIGHYDEIAKRLGKAK